jgi:hypothetical protein
MNASAVLRRFFFCLAVLLIGAATGCGKKTPPVPPGTVLPAAITDLSSQMDEKGVALTWSYPRRTVQGERLPYRIEGFLLSRAVIPLGGECEQCPIPFGPAMEIKAEQEEGGRVFYREALLRPGHRYVYRVRSKAGLFVTSEESNTVSVVWDTPLLAPREFRIQEGDRQLTLRWQEPAALLDGSPLAGPVLYQVYRSTGGAEFTALGNMVDGLEYADSGVRNGIIYHYKVRGVRLLEGTPAAGMATEALAATPRDLSPPAPPGHVTVVATETGLRILWEAVVEEDLAGYRIHRRSAKMAAPVMIGEVGGASLSFLDSALPRGREVWYYSVSAFDRARPPNESIFSMEAMYEKE